MNRANWENLAKFLNDCELRPDEFGNPPLPSRLFNEDGTWGVAYKFNGGDLTWFLVEGPNAPEEDLSNVLSYIPTQPQRTL